MLGDCGGGLLDRSREGSKTLGQRCVAGGRGGSMGDDVGQWGRVRQRKAGKAPSSMSLSPVLVSRCTCEGQRTRSCRTPSSSRTPGGPVAQWTL